MLQPDVKQPLFKTYPWLGPLQTVANKIVSTLYEKEKHYQGSWQRRGGIGAFMMLARKWDRIEACAASHKYDIFEGLESNASDVKDDIDDLIGYLLLVRSYVAEKEPTL